MRVLSIIVGLTAVFGAGYCGLVNPAASITTLLRTPQHDTAVVRSERSGANYAYSTVQNQAYSSVQHIQAVPQIYTNVLPHVYQTPVVYDYSGYYPGVGVPQYTPTVYLEQPVYATFPGSYPFIPAAVPVAPTPSPNPAAEDVPVTPEVPSSEDAEGSREDVEPQTADDDDSVAIDAI